eukprot:6818519-Pyramimonas_sp.AAC.1
MWGLRRRRRWRGSRGGLWQFPHALHWDRGPWDPHRRRRWQGSHGGFGPCRHTPHDDRCPMGGSTESADGRVRTAASGTFGTSFAGIVAPWGAPPNAPVAESAWQH